jgi:hypothetical protein
MTIRPLLTLTVAMLACGSEARAQTEPVPPQPPYTMASLLADGYVTQTFQVFKDKIWMRKPSGEGLAFVCERGRLGSPVFEAYRNQKYDQVPCSLIEP